MRVLITAIRHSIDGAGGSSRFAHDEALRLTSRGHEVWMLAPNAGPDLPDYEFRNGVHFLRYSCRERHALDPRRFNDTGHAITNILRRRAPHVFDVAHGHSLLQHRAACAAIDGGARVCFSVHSPVVDETRATAHARGALDRFKHALRSPILMKLERDCLRNADWVNSFSSFTKTRMAEVHGALAEKIHVTPGWTDTGRFRILGDRTAAKNKLGWATEIPVLFTLRRLFPRMGLDRLIRAAHMLRREGFQFQLVIGGQGPMRQSLQSLAKELGISDSVLFAGFVPDEDLPLAYGACDAFVLPTAELECFGIIAVEALACGRPVLATPVAAIPEIVGRVEAQWLSSDATAESIADLIRKFLSGKLPMHDPERLRSTVQNWWDADRLNSFCDRVLGISRNSRFNQLEVGSPMPAGERQ